MYLLKKLKNLSKWAQISLDNMSVNEIKRCINLKNIIFEITGGITLKNISAYSKLGADFYQQVKLQILLIL